MIHVTVKSRPHGNITCCATHWKEAETELAVHRSVTCTWREARYWRGQAPTHSLSLHDLTQDWAIALPQSWRWGPMISHCSLDFHLFNPTPPHQRKLLVCNSLVDNPQPDSSMNYWQASCTCCIQRNSLLTPIFSCVTTYISGQLENYEKTF